jgi:hypothetical protein
VDTGDFEPLQITVPHGHTAPKLDIKRNGRVRQVLLPKGAWTAGGPASVQVPCTAQHPVGAIVVMGEHVRPSNEFLDVNLKAQALENKGGECATPSPAAPGF